MSMFLRTLARSLSSQVSGKITGPGLKYLPVVSTTTSPHANCPLGIVDGHYYVKEGHKAAPVNGLEYIDGDVVFKNFHTKDVALAYSYDYDLCTRLTEDPNNTMFYLFMPPVFKPEEFTVKLVEEDIEHFMNHPIKKTMHGVFTEPQIDFGWQVARSSAFYPGLDRELRQLAHLTFYHVLLLDDVNESLHTTANPEVLDSWRKNMDRVCSMKSEDRRPRIDLHKVRDFPPDSAARGHIVEIWMSDIMRRFRQFASKDVTQLYVNFYHHFMDGCDLEQRFLRDVIAGKYRKYTNQEATRHRGRTSAVYMVSAASKNDSEARLIWPSNPDIVVSEDQIMAESDTNSYFKENLGSFESGNIVAANQIDWQVAVLGKSFPEAMRAVVLMRNKMLKSLVDKARESPDPAYREMLRNALRFTLCLSDYGIAGGVNDLQIRYGWFTDKISTSYPNLGDRTPNIKWQ